MFNRRVFITDPSEKELSSIFLHRSFVCVVVDDTLDLVFAAIVATGRGRCRFLVG